jgi:hypothetical protein
MLARYASLRMLNTTLVRSGHLIRDFPVGVDALVHPVKNNQGALLPPVRRVLLLLPATHHPALKRDGFG